jgi:tetratricopeptide (TPR) repeat protein
LLAQVLLAAGQFDRAGARFTSLAHDAPDSPEVSAGLGMIALQRGDSVSARQAWKRAIDQGIADAGLCYRYAILADAAGLPSEDIRPALERAVALQPEFDDAHYQLALLEKNARNYEAAVREFHALRTVPEARAYAYWLALADTFNELGRRDEAQSAAQRASEHAATAAERAHAAQAIYMAQTDLGVQFSSDASGHLQLVTTRTPHQQSDWNPFIEAADDIQRVQGTLREIDCGKVTTIRVEASGKLLTLAIPDLQHVQMRHAPPEFVCGPQRPAAPVFIDYARTPAGATVGIVRGMDFRPASASPTGAP